MPPDRGRASKACTACRKQKTRCYETANGRACLRCDRLGQKCSLSVYDVPATNINGELWGRSEGTERDALNEERFGRLEQTMQVLLKRVDDLESRGSQRTKGSPRDTPIENDLNLEQSHGMSDVERTAPPLFVLRDVTTESGFQTAEADATQISPPDPSNNIVLKGLVSERDAVGLLVLFQEHYGRWVCFSPLTSTVTVFEDIRKSPLLFASCCLIAIRHTSQAQAVQLAPKFFEEAKTLLSAAMLSTPQPIGFFQAALILSMWSTTIGRVPLGVDSWLLSGFALQHSIASGLFQTTTSCREINLGERQLNNLCLWNHLCLVHLHYCVGTRRKAVLDKTDINKCRFVLRSDHVTNFETRMVAEVHLYWIMYENCNDVPNLPKTQEALNAWKKEWNFLFDQPRSQFVLMGFYFAQLLIYDQSLKTHSAAARESLLNEMVRLSTSIINLAMETADERTRHLTDHIYHMISFAAVTLCRLLHGYEEQLAASHDLYSLDGQILSLVSWLHAVGFPSHVAYTMGDVVAAFHKKLRPQYGPSPSTSYDEVDPTIQDDFAQIFPELFGGLAFDGMNGSMLPDFQPIL